MRQYPGLTIVIALIASIVAGFLDMILGYAPLPYLIIIAGAAILSAFNVKQTKLIVLMLGGSVLVAHGIAAILGIKAPYEIKSLVDILKPIVLAVGGAFIGVRISTDLTKRQHENLTEEA